MSAVLLGLFVYTLLTVSLMWMITRHDRRS